MKRTRQVPLALLLGALWGNAWSAGFGELIVRSRLGEPLTAEITVKATPEELRSLSARIAIAYNPTCTPNPVPGKAAWPGLRCPVAVALSEDGGLTFPIIRWMERGEGYMGDENKTNNKQYEYPYLMQGRDGMLHLAYAARTRQGIKYVRFSEQDVLGAKRETVGLYNPTAAQSR